MHYELEKLEEALYAGDIQLAKRYVSKIKAILFCCKCKRPILFDLKEGQEQYFKGYIHTECR